jgi:transposase, IS30 family
MPPLSLVVPARTRALSIAEREKIHAGIHAAWSIRAIAASIGRAPSTVSRELRANLRRRYRPEPGAVWNYSPQLAQQRADANAARPKIARLAGNERLRAEVQTRLEDEHSPAQIAARLRVDFADDPEMWVSHETIYQSIYVQGRGGLRRELHKCLRTGRALRKPRRAGRRRQRDRIEGMVNIAERPPEVEDRAVPGHWEGDLITGAKNQSAIGTLVERATSFTMLLHLPDAHGAAEVEAAMVEQMGRLPAMLRKTLTWDQGMEMANHAQIAEATDLTVYFCDPHSPWQRGTNENTNGLLRQYFPKGTDLSIYPADYLDYVAVKLNNRPRKRLGWKTPAEALDQLLSDPSNPPGVAATG